MREPGVNIRPKRHLGYGKRIAGREVVDHKRELENVEKMLKLREQGFSYWKITDILNSMKIKTKTGKGKWHARSIKEILDKSQSKNVTS